MRGMVTDKTLKYHPLKQGILQAYQHDFSASYEVWKHLFWSTHGIIIASVQIKPPKHNNYLGKSMAPAVKCKYGSSFLTFWLDLMFPVKAVLANFYVFFSAGYFIPLSLL